MTAPKGRSRLGADPWAKIAPDAPAPARERTEPVPVPRPVEPSPAAREGLAQLAVRIPPDLLERAKATARLDGGTLRGLVVSALENEIARRREAIRERVQHELDGLG